MNDMYAAYKSTEIERQVRWLEMTLTHMNASSRTLLIMVHKLIVGSSVSGQIILQRQNIYKLLCLE